jgi:hypothetical protein
MSLCCTWVAGVMHNTQLQCYAILGFDILRVQIRDKITGLGVRIIALELSPVRTEMLSLGEFFDGIYLHYLLFVKV